MTMTTNTRTSRGARRLGRLLLAAGLLAVVAHPLGSRAADSTRLLVLVSAFEYRWPWALLASLLLGTGAWLAVRRNAIRVTAAFLCGVAAAGVLGFRLLLFPMLSGDWEETDRRAAPHHAQRHLVVERGSAMIDPLWRISVVDGPPLTAHHWPAGFFNGDDPADELVDVAWSGPDTLSFTTGDGAVTTVRLDRDTGRPEREVSRP